MELSQIIFFVLFGIISLGALLILLYILYNWVKLCIAGTQLPQHRAWHRSRGTGAIGNPDRAPQCPFGRYCSTGDPFEPGVSPESRASGGVTVGDSQGHDPYDPRYTVLCDCTEGWMGDGGSCLHR